MCGGHAPKDLSIRMHECPVCGLRLHRDLVSAKLILKRGLMTA
ncbi:MAG: zinc ribbon domain-containing protein [Desulfitobacterium hafniense]|nr:zinc ribbon domain-containing protein [Desulfitobacterium hafniense]